MDNKKYFLKIVLLILIVVLFRCLFSVIREHYYDYMSYAFSAGALIMIIFPNIEEISFWGFHAKKEKDDVKHIKSIDFKGEIKNE